MGRKKYTNTSINTFYGKLASYVPGLKLLYFKTENRIDVYFCAIFLGKCVFEGVVIEDF